METFVRAVTAQEPRINAQTKWAAVKSCTIVYPILVPTDIVPLWGVQMFTKVSNGLRSEPGKISLDTLTEGFDWVYAPEIDTVFYKRAES